VVKLALGRPGQLFAVLNDSPNYPWDAILHLVDLTTGAVSVGWPFPLTVFPHRDRDELIVAAVRDSMPRADRVTFDPLLGFTLLQRFQSGTYGTSAALSPRGDAFAYAIRDAAGEHVVLLPPDDLRIPFRTLDVPAWPKGLAFDEQGTRLAVGSENELRIFEVPSGVALDALTLPSCTHGSIESAAFSRGGALAFAERRCSSGSLTLRWLRVD
jgi:hypothetical protein